MSGYEGVVFLVTFGAITAGGVQSIKAQQGNSSSGPTNLGDAQDLAGTGIAVADDEDNTTFALEIHKPTDRYVRPVVSRATQDSVVTAITAIRYGAHKAPVAAGSGITDSESHVSPAEGTA
jgi:hypothetical protein